MAPDFILRQESNWIENPIRNLFRIANGKESKKRATQLQLKIAGRLLETLNVHSSILGSDLLVHNISEETAAEIQIVLDRDFVGTKIKPHQVKTLQRSSLVR